MNECPRCKSQQLTTGRISLNGRSRPLALAFVPGKLKWFRFSLEGGAELKSEVFACLGCGMVWTEVAYPENLREIVARVEKPH